MTESNGRVHENGSAVRAETGCVRVAVVGAGPGGLAAAVLAAARGAEVTVFEAADRVGGRCARITKHTDRGEFHFDTGPTFFLMPYVLEEIFAAAGERLQDHVDLRRLDPMYRLIIGRDGLDPITLDTTQDIELMARRIAAINESDGPAFERFIADNRRKLALMESILRRPIRGPLDLVLGEDGGDVIKFAPMLKPHKSIHQLLGEYFTDEHVKLAACFQSKYLGMSPFDCPSLFSILPFIEYEYGVWHPMGGCNTLMRAMGDVGEKLGVDVRTNAPVERITFTGRRATGVVVDGKEHVFDAVVINADAAWALKHLVPTELRSKGAAKGYSDAALDAKRYSCSTMMLYLGLEGAVDLPHHTIYTSAAYRENLADITDHKRLSDDPSVYVCNPSGIDPTLAPDGHNALYVLMPTPNLQPKAGETENGSAAIDWSSEAGPARERMLDQLERVFGVERVRERIVCEHVVTPEDWRGMGINFGATFNLAHNLGQMLHRRPQNRLKGFERLYMVGGGTHPGSGLPTIFLSAQISTRLLAGDTGLGAPRGRVPVPSAVPSVAVGAAAV